MDRNDNEKHLYPPIEPYKTGFLEVSKIHKLYYEECGSPNGIPVLFIHGGPGAGIFDRDRRYFDPEAYHIVLLDQRGAGKSTPASCLEENDTWNLVADLEKLREHLGIEKWMIFGGSWGSTLSILYAQSHIDRILGMVIQGIFTFRDEEMAWLYQQGASSLFPDFWDEFIAPIPEEERGDMISSYYKRLTGDNKEEQIRCARAFAKWEMAIFELNVNPENLNLIEDDAFTLAMARIESHFMVNKGFVKCPNQIMNNAHIIQTSGIPVTIVQGRYDTVCPPRTAWDLRKRIPNAEFHMIPAAGHSPLDGGITKTLVEACDKYKIVLKK